MTKSCALKTLNATGQVNVPDFGISRAVEVSSDAMTVENRNRELGELGLPAATILEPPIIVYAPIEQMKTSSSSQAPTTYQGDDCSEPIAPAACDGEFAGPECMACKPDSFGLGCL